MIRTALVAVVGVWVASRTVFVSNSAVWVPVPLIGHLRIDMAVPCLLLQMAALLTVPAAPLVGTVALGLVGLHICAPPVIYSQQFDGEHIATEAPGANVTVHEAIISEAVRLPVSFWKALPDEQTILSGV